jgi:acetyl-CoA carboxylase beta subunit
VENTKLFCKHEQLETVTNIYGDAINKFGGARSMRKCKKCSKIIWHKELDKNCNKINEVAF